MKKSHGPPGLVMILVYLFLAVMCGACYGAGGALVQEGSDETITGRGAWQDVEYTPRQYLRADSPAIGPYYILLAPANRYCAVDEDTWYGPGTNIGQRFRCRWRFVRVVP